MPIKIQTTVNYEELCNELGITLEELLLLVKNKDKHQLNGIKTSAVKVINEYRDNVKLLHTLNRRSNETIKTYENFIKRLKLFLEDSYPELLITEISEDIVYELLKKSTARKNKLLSVNTINKYLAIVRSILSFAFTKGYTEKE